jgi:hypothetical protein
VGGCRGVLVCVSEGGIVGGRQMKQLERCHSPKREAAGHLCRAGPHDCCGVANGEPNKSIHSYSLACDVGDFRTGWETLTMTPTALAVALQQPPPTPPCCASCTLHTGVATLTLFVYVGQLQQQA